MDSPAFTYGNAEAPRVAAISAAGFVGQTLALFTCLCLPEPSWLAYVTAVAGPSAAARLLLGGGGGWAAAWRSSLIGAFFSLGLWLAAWPISEGWRPAGLYFIFLSSFHLSEFLATAATNPANLSTDSFLLNHSPAYHAAALASWAEYALELWLAPGMKALAWARAITLLGVLACLSGEMLRKLAMAHAGRSFSHIVRMDLKDDHRLVQDGVFALCRHPSYAGWFCWSVGTQLVLVNPVCSLAYAVASWRFFNERIYAEEWSLVHFFGQEYADYRKRVHSGLPFINGFEG